MKYHTIQMYLIYLYLAQDWTGNTSSLQWRLSRRISLKDSFMPFVFEEISSHQPPLQASSHAMLRIQTDIPGQNVTSRVLC